MLAGRPARCGAPDAQWGASGRAAPARCMGPRAPLRRVLRAQKEGSGGGQKEEEYDMVTRFVGKIFGKAAIGAAPTLAGRGGCSLPGP